MCTIALCVCACVCVCTCVCVCVRVYVCVDLHVYVCVWMCMCVCTYAHVCVWTAHLLPLLHHVCGGGLQPQILSVHCQLQRTVVPALLLQLRLHLQHMYRAGSVLASPNTHMSLNWQQHIS